MGNNCHGRATTTPAIRKKIQESTETIKALAQRYGINHNTVKKWRSRKSTEDQKCGPKSRSTTLTREEEAAIVTFRKDTKSSLDDCLYALKKEITTLTRSSLYRCLKRHNINKLPSTEKKKFATYPPPYVHVEITQVYTEDKKTLPICGHRSHHKILLCSYLQRSNSSDSC